MKTDIRWHVLIIFFVGLVALITIPLSITDGNSKRFEMALSIVLATITAIYAVFIYNQSKSMKESIGQTNALTLPYLVCCEKIPSTQGLEIENRSRYVAKAVFFDGEIEVEGSIANTIPLLSTTKPLGPNEKGKITFINPPNVWCNSGKYDLGTIFATGTYSLVLNLYSVSACEEYSVLKIEISVDKGTVRQREEKLEAMLRGEALAVAKDVYKRIDGLQCNTRPFYYKYKTQFSP